MYLHMKHTSKTEVHELQVPVGFTKGECLAVGYSGREHGAETSHLNFSQTFDSNSQAPGLYIYAMQGVGWTRTFMCDSNQCARLSRHTLSSTGKSDSVPSSLR